MQRALTKRAAKRQLLLRVIAALALAVGVFVQFSSALHFVLVEHAICAEHGELVHESEPHDTGSHAERPLDVDEASVVASGSTDLQHGHEHCAGLGTLRDAAAIPPRSDAQSLVRPTGEAAALGPALRSGDPPFALFLLAPKNSPPA